MPMHEKLPNTPQEWADPEDAPELTDTDFRRGIWKIGGETVSHETAQTAISTLLRHGRPKAKHTKRSLTLRYDADIVEAFRATGRGWQTRMNNALRDWLKTHSPA